MYRCSSVWPGVQDRGQVSYIGISERFLPSQTADKCLPFDFFIAYVYAVQIVNLNRYFLLSEQIMSVILIEFIICRSEFNPFTKNHCVKMSDYFFLLFR